MLLKRIYLRNYRVYEDELDLEIPPGLVGIYGANGAGKSYLVEAVLFALWGKTRTSMADVRTTGVGGDCVVEVQFEHEGHLYAVRRTLSGVNAVAKASAFADGAQVAEGVKDTGRYVHSVLGMDDAAFRSSVFAEQKQLAAFSLQRPQQRKELVLKLLGIMPLDTARDDARKDARVAREQLDHLSRLLPDLEEVRHRRDDALAAAEAAAVDARTEEAAWAVVRARLADTQRRLDQLEELRRSYEALVAEGRAARGEHDGVARRVAELDAEVAGLAAEQERLDALAPAAAGLEEAEAELAAVRAVESAAAAVARLPVPDAVAPPDEDACEAARVEAEEAGTRLAAVEGELAGAGADLRRAREVAGKAASLSGEADCPLCGQALGGAFEQVQRHRAAEVAAGEERVAGLERRRHELAQAAGAARARARTLADELRAAREAWAAAEQARARRAAAEQALAEVEASLGRSVAEGEPARLAAAVGERRAAAKEVARLQAHLERAPALAARLEAERARLAEAAARVEALRAEVRAVGFSPESHAEVREERDDAATAAEKAAAVAQDARLAAERAQVTADGEVRRVAEAEQQHAKLAGLAEQSRHLGRVADLLAAFRNNVVGTVGPRLAVHAAELFAELTDREYDQLELDPDTYEITIRDQGRAHGMQRFSGSETDLANLAVRVAISEHVRLLSGGTVGLLVLDEVFGPLDEDRKARMLGALERLRGRFRQVLVVTHDDAIKAELPNAIEVVKRPGRRATAHVMNA
ncbi:MAG TPA: SMC family ATPase [Acidimicrobiales bacterium]|nr:SMC family ATPase [Acidimicrobiales bacterium]